MDDYQETELTPEEIPSLEEEIEFQRQAAEMAEQYYSPESNMYFRVVGTDYIVRTTEGVNHLAKEKIPLEYVTYNQARDSFNQHEAKKRKHAKARAKAKAARRQRIRNGRGR